jgi:uncharacterized protein YjbJ (UPF0337 family)
MNMNWDGIAGKWKQIVGEVKKKWGKLTNNEPMEVNGNGEVLAGKVQDVAKDEANQQIDK